jgi:hypothetical protein
MGFLYWGDGSPLDLPVLATTDLLYWGDGSPLDVLYNPAVPIEVDVDIIGIDINMLSISIQEIIPIAEAINIAISALTLAPLGYSVSVDTTNILISLEDITIQNSIPVSIIPIDITVLEAIAELVSKRLFPRPPTQRQTQSQPGARKFPVLH